ncbi:uncharacterized protein DFL_002158 [Arthrobotrys flagrans]|uniref:Uncharacterized protein n=1 Tax=Arthrobotrys flagrans TaxID=97331 RepID=A0A437A9W9_ARTFL|nr:hypothetical protein DFL_002158 [Arthrobotrys flagrans]
MGKNKNKNKNKKAPAQDASASKAAEPKPVESKPVEEPIPAPVATPAQVSTALALPEEPTPARPLELGKSANSLKDAMTPTTEEPALKEEPIPKKSVEFVRKSTSKEPKLEPEPIAKEPEQEKAKEIPEPSTSETPQETMKEQTSSQVTAPAVPTVPYASPSTEAPSSKPPTGVQDIHTDVTDVKLPEPAHTSTTKKNQIEEFKNESNRPTTSSSAGGKAPSAIGTATDATGQPSATEERVEPKKEGGFKGLWSRIVAAFK